MLKVRFETNRRPINPGAISDVLERAMLKEIEDYLREQIGTSRDPETGELPTIVASGESLDGLTLHAEGSKLATTSWVFVTSHEISHVTDVNDLLTRFAMYGTGRGCTSVERE
jgi:hypothetical protein